MQPQPLKGLGSSELEEQVDFPQSIQKEYGLKETLRPDFCSLDCVSIHFNVMSPSCHNLYGILTKLLLESSCVCSYP